MALAQTPNPLEYLADVNPYGYDFSSMEITIFGTNVVFGGPLKEYESFSWSIATSKPEKPSTSPIVPGFGVGKMKVTGSFVLSQEQGQILVEALAAAGAPYGLGATTYAFNINVQYGPLPGAAPGTIKLGKIQIFSAFLTKVAADDSQDNISKMSFDYVASYALVNGSRPV